MRMRINIIVANENPEYSPPLIQRQKMVAFKERETEKV